MKKNSRCFKIVVSLAFLLLLTSQYATSQTAAIKWFPQIKTAKDQHTVMLLNANETGFYLLRWQGRRTDANGHHTPALPILTVLTPTGERLHDEPLPGFEDGLLDFRFCMASDSVLLVVYEAPNSAGSQSLFARRLNLANLKWSAAPQVLFTDVTNRAPAFANVWFRRSQNGRQICVYRMYHGKAPRVAMALIDGDFRLQWQRTLDLPKAAGQISMRQVFCSDGGAVLLHCQIFNSQSPSMGQLYETTPAVFNANGRGFCQNETWETETAPYADAVFLLEAEQGLFADFYPNLGKKFTPAFEISEGLDGKFYCAGFYSDKNNAAAEGYFIYGIDPENKRGELLKMATLPNSLRAVYLSKKAAAKKEAVEGLRLRWLSWSKDGSPWLLAEQQNIDLGPERMEAAALMRLDTTFRIRTVQKVEKIQRLQTGDPQNFASIASIQNSKNGWFLLWNQGTWPNAKIMLTECGARGTPSEFSIDNAAHSNVSLLPQTLLKQGDNWYFVGESEYHERIRVGVLERP